MNHPIEPTIFRDLCNGMRPKELLAWQKLDRSTEAPDDVEICTEIDSPTVPNRDLESCSVLSRYERARFGTEREQDEDSKPDKMWDCHIGLSGKSTVGVTKQRIKWDLRLPMPKKVQPLWCRGSPSIVVGRWFTSVGRQRSGGQRVGFLLERPV